MGRLPSGRWIDAPSVEGAYIVVNWKTAWKSDPALGVISIE